MSVKLWSCPAHRSGQYIPRLSILPAHSGHLVVVVDGGVAAVVDRIVVIVDVASVEVDVEEEVEVVVGVVVG